MTRHPVVEDRCTSGVPSWGALAGGLHHNARRGSDQGGELIRVIAAFATAALLAGCRAAPAEPTITRDQFVDAIVQLRQADAETDDAAVFEARKAEILGEAGVTDSMLLAYARVHGHDIALMAEVWDTIARRLVRADTLPR